MADMKNIFENARVLAKKADNATQKIQDKAKEGAVSVTNTIIENTAVVRDTAVSVKRDIDEKLTELDRMLESAVNEYNDAYTLMNDKGMSLYVERVRSADALKFTENIVNTISNRPRSFDSDFETIKSNREKFTEICDFAAREVKAAREAAGDAGAGVAAGAAVAFMAPSAAMWIATTFGYASTGAAISTLSGAAATNAALAWLGGGALAANGGGMVAGKALLALAGPVGWGIAGATLMSSIVIYSKKRNELNKRKSEEIESVKKNTEKIKEADAAIGEFLTETKKLREMLSDEVTACMSVYGADYSALTENQKADLMKLVLSAKSLSRMFGKTVE